MAWNVSTGNTTLISLSKDLGGTLNAWSWVLVFVFVVITGLGFAKQQARTPNPNIAMWASIAGLITSTGAFFLYLIPGLIPLTSVMITVAVTLGCSLWFLTTNS